MAPHGKSKKTHAKALPRTNPPPIFICPLTYKVMENPVMDRCAHNFERDAITEWFKAGCHCCPISRKELKEEDLRPNHSLAEQIEKWRWEQGHDFSQFKLDNKSQDTVSLSSSFSTDSESEVSARSLDDSLEGACAVIKVEIGHDLEKGLPPPKPKGNALQLSDVPEQHFLLLPQERELLQAVRIRAFEFRQRRRYLMIRDVVVGVSVAVGTVALGVIAIKVIILLLTEGTDVQVGAVLGSN